MEYVILLAIIVSLFALLSQKLAEIDALGRLQKPFKEEFARTYRYGHPEARGEGEGGPLYIPQYDDGADGSNFRIFINPDNPGSP